MFNSLPHFFSLWHPNPHGSRVNTREVNQKGGKDKRKGALTTSAVVTLIGSLISRTFECVLIHISFFFLFIFPLQFTVRLFDIWLFALYFLWSLPIMLSHTNTKLCPIFPQLSSIFFAFRSVSTKSLAHYMRIYAERIEFYWEKYSLRPRKRVTQVNSR